jgi:hypothetical protein
MGLLADFCDVFIKVRLDLHKPHKWALQFRCLSSRKISQLINTGAEFLVYDTLQIDSVPSFDICFDFLQMIRLIVFWLPGRILYDRTPKHEMVLIIRKVFSGVLDIPRKLVGKLLNIVGPLVLDVLQPGRQMNCYLADVNLLLLQVEADDVDLSLRFDSVEVGLNEIAAPDIPKVRRNQLLTNVQHATYLPSRLTYKHLSAVRSMVDKCLLN